VRRVASEVVRRRLFVPALLVALVLRIGFALTAIHGYEPTVGDPRDYVLLAENLRAGRGFVLPWVWAEGTEHSAPLRPTALRPPLYPLLLSAVFTFAGHSLPAVVTMQALMDVVSCALIGLTAASLFGPTAGVTAVWWAALYPALWVHVARIWSECLFVALGVLLLFTLSTQRQRSLVNTSLRSGLLVGLLCLTRPNGIFFLPALLILANHPAGLRERLEACLLVVLAMSLVLLPWTIRNYRQFGRFIPLSTMDAAALRGASHDAVLVDPRLRGGWSVGPMLAEAQGSPDEIELHDRLLEASRRWIRDHWRDWPRLAAYRFVSFWSVDWYSSEIHFLDRFPWLEGLYRACYVLTSGFALGGLWRSRHRFSEIRHLIAIVLSFSVSAMLVWGNWRMRAPVEPVLVLLAAACFQGRRRAAR
jgi:4-amino-4-deoxy-L-arabinose transferase-like glycosyltransferase